jgi:hypothetical protein
MSGAAAIAPNVTQQLIGSLSGSAAADAKSGLARDSMSSAATDRLAYESGEFRPLGNPIGDDGEADDDVLSPDGSGAAARKQDSTYRGVAYCGSASSRKWKAVINYQVREAAAPAWLGRNVVCVR